VTGNLPDRRPDAGVLVGTGGIARRTAELARQDQPVILWQRTLARGADPVITDYSDDAVTVGDERIDIRTGHTTPVRFPALDGEAYGCRTCGGVLVSAQRTARGVYVAGSDRHSGGVLWRHEPMLYSEYIASPRGQLMLRLHHDPDVLIAHGPTFAGQRIELIDWRTGRSAWAVPWPAGARPESAWSLNGHAPEYFYDEHGDFRQLHGDQDATAPGTVASGTAPSGTVRMGRHVRIAVAVNRRYSLWPDTNGLAGVDEADGTIVWRIRKPDAGTGFRSGPPAYLGGTDRHLVLVAAVGHNQAAPIVSG
jgi:hypothetical protein